jgi:hypothetical protein
MKPITIGLIIIVIILTGCFLKDSSPTNSNYELDSLDYVVISSAIEQYFFHPNTLSHRFQSSFDSLAGIDRAIKREDIKMLLIEDSTINYLDSVSQYVHREHNVIDGSDSSLTEKIVEVNQNRFKIDNSKITTFETRLISNNEIRTLLDSIIYYGADKLYKKYPTAFGIISCSKPAFNTNKDRAIIYLSFYNDPDSGHGDFLWLKKVDSKWIVYDLVFLWVS